MNIYRNGTAIELTAQELEDAYREQEDKYLLEDAYSRVEEFEYDDSFAEDDYKNIVEQFKARRVSNISHYNTWQDVIDEYARQKGII